MHSQALSPVSNAAPAVIPSAASMPAQPIDDRIAWDAVLARDAAFDGRFVYGVLSTGVYCRPTCPSRRPLRKNVAFFATNEAAEASGLRPCRRCQPKAATTPALRAIVKVRRYIEEHVDEPLTLEILSDVAGLSPYHLQRMFKRATGLSPKEYARSARTERFKSGVRSESSVTDAIYEAGYGSGSRVYERADAELGMTPATYRKGGYGMRIRYALADSPLGRLLVGATERGVCSVQLGASDRALEKALRDEYPHAEIERDESELGGWLRPVLERVRGGAPSLELPLDIRATAFEWRVWNALRDIPFGERRSYGEVARSIGRPTATRAVAQACAHNRVAVVIPCHRVVRGDGSLGGYRWGIERKKRLLEQEESRRASR